MNRPDFLASITRRGVLQTGGVALATAATLPTAIHAAQPATPGASPAIDLDAIDQFAAEALDTYGVPVVPWRWSRTDRHSWSRAMACARSAAMPRSMPTPCSSWRPTPSR